MSSTESEVVVIGSWASMYTSRVRIALAEKSIGYEFIEEDLSDRSPLLLKYNPIYKKIPVMIHKGRPICESLIIVQYIHETWKEGYPLLPSDPYLKSQAAFWADYIDKHIYSGAKKFLMSKGEEKQKGVEEFLGYLKVLESELGEKPYFNGESFGYVDMALICFYSHIIAFGKIGNFSVEKDIPKLFAWATQCLKRESVSKALADPNKIYESLIAFKKRNGVED
ncbi:putative glutathione transferase [Helianthus annuus]|uniref:glutathione transferase n=1 Tax=Helianthus annuus TaxID=4232 RepID=A0A251THQ5_HELAN|nr:glutathione S-transferase U19 [Helianthus annuus]KAF5786809.1 putative glutathione transferase [Helianthus annuus]KAJ0514168.1 putative glutathione transferase [Helianthus annuus]KAJ0530291.1 putative glutathione transferase [Helianthus annuus]KAJ0879995.1 putative glutathione transferase [Helianthus annuus]